MTRLLAASATDAGRVRTSNQDLALVKGDLIVVADGMGGHAGGEVAARTAVEALERAFASDSTAEGLREAAASANLAVFARAEREQALRGMGTTLTAAAIVHEGGADAPEQVILVNVGDSRAYLYAGGELRRLTEDHSLVEEMVRHGELTPEAALTHPHRHILTRALGIDPAVEIDDWLLSPEPGSRLLLCSDGLTNECSDEEIAGVLGDNADPAEAAQQLVARALDHGGSDNITVVVADLDDSVAPAREQEQAAVAAPPAASRSLSAQDAGVGPTVAVPRTPQPPTHAPRSKARATGSARLSRPPRAAGGAERRERAPIARPRDPIVTVRVLLFTLVLLAILGGIAGFAIWFNRASYFVGIADGRIAIFEGRPGGFLWFQPTIVDQTSLTASSVLPAELQMFEHGVLESSYEDARNVVTNLSEQRNLLGFTTNSGVTPAPSQAVSASSTTTVAPHGTSTTGAKAKVSH